MPSCDLLLTGAGGFVGGHVATRARAQGLEVCEVAGDVRDVEAVAKDLKRHRPGALIHLASSWRRHSDAPWHALADDVGMAGALLDAVARHSPDTVILIAGTAAQYGLGLPRPLREDDELPAVSAYGAAGKVLEAAVLAEPLRQGVRVIHTRSFNHVGTGQGLNAPVAQWAARIVDAERGGVPVVPVGRLDVVRDVLDVRDVADAYLGLVGSSRAEGVYNVSSGLGVRMEDLLDMLVTEAQVSLRVEEDASLVRATDPPMVVGDPGRLREATGWRPTIDLRDSVREVLEQWRGVSEPLPENMTVRGGRER